MREIKFADGQRMPWMTYRAMMANEISPFKAVAATRRSRAAYDAALPRRVARDQNGGRLSQVYCDATEKFLGDNGVDPDDVAGIMKVLSRYIEEPAAEDEENLEMADPKRVPVGPPRGPVGSAQDRRFALDELDQFGQPRRNLATPMPLGGGDKGFAERFPDAARIRTA
jgi:hypothetical protein